MQQSLEFRLTLLRELLGRLAVAAKAGDLEAMGVDGEGGLRGKALADLQDVAAVELDDSATIRADHVIVRACAEAVFVVSAVVAEEGAAEDSGIDQEG
jgi:hypothetical protein